MSRGPGVWQRRILARIANGSVFYLADILGDRYTRADYQAAWRAADRMVGTGVLGAQYYAFGRDRALFGPPGLPRPKKRPYSRRETKFLGQLSVDRVTRGDPVDT